VFDNHDLSIRNTHILPEDDYTFAYSVHVVDGQLLLRVWLCFRRTESEKKNCWVTLNYSNRLREGELVFVGEHVGKTTAEISEHINLNKHWSYCKLKLNENRTAFLFGNTYKKSICWINELTMKNSLLKHLWNLMFFIKIKSWTWANMN